MADSQVEGLRRAYAEIMLNMAKESAARVLAAERRAAALAGGMAAAKEDGVAALVRLKAVMDARIDNVMGQVRNGQGLQLLYANFSALIKQVESQSLAHVKRIKELQEQLHGALNTVASLQVELQRANTELEQTRKTLAEERIKSLLTCDKISSNKNSSSRFKMHLQNRSVSSKNKNNTADDTCRVPTNAKESGAVENLENLYHCGSDVASFMARNKKPELYRNGCTQRIHALKQRSPSADTSLEQNSKQTSALNSRSKTGKNHTDKNPCRTRSIMEQILQTKFLANCKRKRGRRSRPSYKHDDSGEHGITEYKSSGTSDGNGCLLLLQALEQDLSPLKVSTSRGEGLTNLKDDLFNDGKDADFDLCTASPGPQDVHAVSNMQMKKRKRSKTVRVFEAGHSESKSVLESGNTTLRSANENTMFNSELSSERIDNCSDTPPRNNGPVLQYTTENSMHSTDADTGDFKSENSSPLSLQSTKSEIEDEGDLQVDLPECRTPENKSAGWKEVNVDESCNLPPDRSDASVVSSLDKELNEKASSGVSMQAEGVRCIKYTFNRRKRKGASLDSTQGAVPDKSSSLVSLADNQEPQAKPETQDLLIESPRGDSHLVHVAQQLILLSERKQ